MSARRTAAADSERGMILVVVLWLVAMMTVVVVALSALARSSLSEAGIAADRLRNEMILESGIDAAAGLVQAAPQAEWPLFDGTPATVDLGGGATVAIAITEASGLVDVNRADKDLLTAYASGMGMAQAGAFVDAVMKWRQTAVPAGPSGAAAQAGASPAQQQAATGGAPVQSPPRPATPADPQQIGGAPVAAAKPAVAQRPGAFFSLAQLYAIPGIAPEDIARILRFAGLYSSDGKVNPLAAPQPVLDAIPGLTDQQKAAIMAARAGRRPADPAVLQIVAQFSKFLAIPQARSFVVEVKGVSGPHVMPGSSLRAVIVTVPGEPAYHVMAWSW